jgi:hypothetical protein
VKVYLSSTFRDLREHRAAVDRTLRRMGHDVIGMEQYAAEGSRPVDRCKRDVELADCYVLMLGWRYGYVPGDDNADRLSITEIEYRHAIEKQRTVLAFLLDPEEPWPPSSMDSASADVMAATAINRFRAEVGKEYLSGIFSSPADLASQVAAAVAAQGMSIPRSQLVLNRDGVSATSMGGFGTGGTFDTRVGMIKEKIREVGTDRALVIDLGEGDTWWSTRLFLLAGWLRSLTLVRQLVFTGRGGRFAGMASPSAVVEGLEARSPVLAEFARQLRLGEASEDRVLEIDRQLGVWSAIFKGAGQAPSLLHPRDPIAAPDINFPTDERHVTVGVREELLRAWLGERLIDRCIRVDGRLSMSQVQQIVDCLVPDVPLEIHPLSALNLPAANAAPVAGPTTRSRGSKPPPATVAEPPGDVMEPAGVQVKVIDRDAYALELAREWVRTGLPRNPAL